MDAEDDGSEIPRMDSSSRTMAEAQLVRNLAAESIQNVMR